MKKLIGRLLAIVLIAALAVCGIVTYNGYQLYKEAVAAVPVSEKVAAIEAQTHYTTYDALPKRYIEAVIAASSDIMALISSRPDARCGIISKPGA